MRIIDKVEINYFRSIYTISFKDISDINVISGSNDAGKSNILKALNLFFNNETEPHSFFNFTRDLSRDREREAREQKGRMTIWIRVTFNNFLNWKSLPQKFSVKRTWNRYDDGATDAVDGEIPATTLGRFLAKIKFNYIPAVRSREIFSDLLVDLHDTLIQDESAGLRKSSDTLVKDLQLLTNQMSASILEGVKLDSKIDLPESLEDLFRALNFLTKFGDHDIPLILRGDGLQSRHLPFILSYIAEKSNNFHIWGYEEPENSLELSKAFEMARDFHDTFSKNNQIFLTTHSPAFYDLSGDKVSKWFAENRNNGEFSSTEITPLTSSHDIDKTMGLLNVITPRMKDVYEHARALQKSLAEMTETLAESQCPIIYVEGPTDVIILTHAKQATGHGDLNMRFESANGASNITQFLKASSRLKSEDRPLIGLFDADARGRKEYDCFKNYHILEKTNFRTIDKGKKIFAGILKRPDHLQKAEDALAALNLKLPLPIEFMFSDEIILKAIEAGTLSLSPRFATVQNEELPLQIRIDESLSGKLDSKYLYLVNSIDSNCKITFANWVVQQNNSIFDVFKETFDMLAVAAG